MPDLPASLAIAPHMLVTESSSASVIRTLLPDRVVSPSRPSVTLDVYLYQFPLIDHEAEDGGGTDRG
jgi:hypothetical protein